MQNRLNEVPYQIWIHWYSQLCPKKQDASKHQTYGYVPTLKRIASKCLLDALAFKQRLLSVAMRERGKQAQASDRPLSVLNACASTVDVLWQTAGDTNRLYSRWRLVGKICPPPTSAHTQQCQTCTYAEAKGPHSHRDYWTAHDSTAHTVVHTSRTDTVLGTACSDCKHWRKIPSEFRTKGLFYNNKKTHIKGQLIYNCHLFSVAKRHAQMTRADSNTG